MARVASEETPSGLSSKAIYSSSRDGTGCRLEHDRCTHVGALPITRGPDARLRTRA